MYDRDPDELSVVREVVVPSLIFGAILAGLCGLAMLAFYLAGGFNG